MQKNINHFKVIGISHHLATVEQREKASLSANKIKHIHDHLIHEGRGGFVLSTCNRTEIYFIADEVESIIRKWSSLSKIAPETLKQYLYTYEGKDAITYLFRVGSGLDSQILGDFQIIGQIKQAYKQALIDGAGNAKLTRMFDMLLKTSKRIKNETQLSSGVASMAYAAIQHVGKMIDKNWENQHAFVYGAGKMGTAVIRKLVELMPANKVEIGNRTLAKAEQLAEKYKVTSNANDSIQDGVKNASFIISTAAVEEPIFTKKALETTTLKDKIFIDLSMPRSVSPELESLGATVINLDYLQDIQNETFAIRQQAIPQAEEILTEELTAYFTWIKQQDLRPTMYALKEKLQIIKEVEVKRIKKTSQSVDEAQIDQIAQALINKVATQCIKHIKKNNGNSLQLIHDIFELETTEEHE